MSKEFFLYENVYRDLKDKIMDGTLKPGEKLDAEKEMELRYHVSAITVKKALGLLADEGMIERVRGRGTFVSEKKEKKEQNIFLKKEEPEKKERGIIGVIFEHISSSYGLQMMYELERQARKAGYHLFPCFSYGDRELETQTIRYLLKIGVKGLLVMPAHGTHYNTELLKLVIEEFPMILIDKKMDGIPLDSVRNDGKKSMRQLVEYLADRGKKKIALVTVDESGTSSLVERKQGFYEGMKEQNLIPQKECTLPFIDYENPHESYGKIYRAKIREYLAETGDKLDGIICSEYGVAMEVVPELDEKKLSDQIEVCCIDENYIGPDQYRLTHIKQDEKSMAECAMKILLEKINGKKMEQKDYLIPGIFTKRK